MREAYRSLLEHLSDVMDSHWHWVSDLWRKYELFHISLSWQIMMLPVMYLSLSFLIIID